MLSGQQLDGVHVPHEHCSFVTATPCIGLRAGDRPSPAHHREGAATRSSSSTTPAPPCSRSGSAKMLSRTTAAALGTSVARHDTDDTIAARPTRVLTRHRRVRAGFVHRYQMRRGDAADRLEEGVAPGRSAFRVVFLGNEGPTFRVKPSRATARTIVERDTSTRSCRLYSAVATSPSPCRWRTSSPAAALAASPSATPG